MKHLHARRQKAYLLISLASLIPFAAVGVLRELNLFDFVELKLLDGRMKFAGLRASPISPKMAMIVADPESERELGPAPWPPHIYGSMINALHNGANPKGISLIAWFNRGWPGEEPLPGEKLYVIQPYDSVAEASKASSLPEVTSWYSLPRSLTSAQHISFSRFPFNTSDGIFRAAQLVVRDEMTGELRYALEMLMLLEDHHAPSASIVFQKGLWVDNFLEISLPAGQPLRIPIDAQGRFLVKFAGNTADFSPRSFLEALSMSADAAAFEQSFSGKYVLIGAETPGVYKAPTPKGEMSALALRANLINALLNRDFVWQLNRNGNTAYLLVLALLTTLVTVIMYRNAYRYRLMLVLGLGLLACHLVCSISLFLIFNIWVEMAGSSLALVLGLVTGGFCLAHLRLRHLLWQLQTTQEQLVRSEKEAVFGLMSARVRHELRNSLNLIRGPAEMIRNNFQRNDPLKLTAQPDELVKEMNAIIDWVTKLDEMIENELSFFQGTRLNRRKLELTPPLHAALEMMKPVISENRVTVELHLPGKIPPLSIDDDKIRIALANLIKNGCQAMPSGGKLNIEVDTSQPGWLVLIVSDTGVGISPAELPYIFEPFHTTKARGLGLGLVNVKNIIEGHDGHIRVESKVGAGTTFYIELPYTVAMSYEP